MAHYTPESRMTTARLKCKWYFGKRLSKGDADRLHREMNIIINYASDRFGYVQNEHKKETTNKRGEMTIQLRHELRSLKK